MADFVAIGLRGLAFVAVLQAAGIPIFISLFGENLDRSGRAIRAMAALTAAGGLLLTAIHAAVEPARLTGELGDIFDGSLQALLLSSDFGTTTAIRVFGLALILAGSLGRIRLGEAVALIGASLVVVSFTFMGHTAADAQRWLLAPLLITHLIAVAFWFGGLWPLLSSTRRESAAVGGAIIEAYSRVAIWLVPLIFVAGIGLALTLLPDLSSLRTPYGYLLMVKVSGFAILMAFAAANKWRFGPKVSDGDGIALQAFQRSVLAEWFLIMAVVLVTAAMTALFSPEH